MTTILVTDGFRCKGGGEHCQMFSLGWGYCTKFKTNIETGMGTPHIVKRQVKLLGEGGTPHIQFMDIWPDVLNGVGTPHIILRKSLAVGGWGWVVQAR